MRLWKAFLIALSIHLGLLLLPVARFLAPTLSLENTSQSLQMTIRTPRTNAIETAPTKVESTPKPTPKPTPIPIPRKQTKKRDVKPPKPQADSLPLTAGPASKSTHQSNPALVSRADYLRNPPPEYPTQARRGRLEGRVMLKVSIDSHGIPKEVAIQESSGHSILDEAALRTVKTWRFTPSRANGKAMDSMVLVPIKFKLK